MLDYYYSVLELSIKILNITGLSPERRVLWKTLWMIFSISVMAFLILLSFVYDTLTFKHVIELLLSVFLLFHSIIRNITPYWKRNDLLCFMQGMNQFWPIQDENFFPNERLEKQCLRILHYCRVVVKIMACYVYGLVFSLPVFSALGAGLTYEVYKPTFLPYIISVLFEFVYMNAVVPAMISIDCIVAALAILLWMQFRILNHRISAIDYSDNKLIAENMLKRCAEHHRFLLKYCKKYHELFSSMFLMLIYNEAALICVLLYTISASNEDKQIFIKAIALFGIAIMEPFIFFFMPIQFLIDEAAKVGSKLYFSRWYECQRSTVQKSLIIVIMRAQKELDISAKGLLQMNLTTFKIMIKSSFSFLAFLHHIHDKTVTT